MKTSLILKSVGFTKIPKSRYLKNEILFFLKVKKLFYYTSRANSWQKIVLWQKQPLIDNKHLNHFSVSEI